MVIRIETRWQAALERAVSANLLYMELIGGDGAYAVSSQRDDERGYVVTADTCTCPAGRGGDPVCCHRALVRALVGVLPVDAAPQPVSCRACHGAGSTFREHYGERRPCDACGGSGVKPDHRPQGTPAVLPVAVAA